MSTVPPRGRPPVRTWPRVMIGISIVVATLLLLFAGVVLSGSVRESRAIEAVRASGDPLAAREIPFPSPSEPSDLLDRLDRFQLLFTSAPTFRDIDLTSREEFVAEVRAAPGSHAAAALVEGLFACAGDEPLEFVTRADAIQAKLSHPRHVGRLESCERRLLLTRAALAEPLLEPARDVCLASPESAESVLAAWSVEVGLGLGKEQTSIVCVGHAVRTLTDTAIARAVEGRSAEALELIASAFRGANLVRDWPTLLGHGAWHFAMWLAIDGLQATLGLLPIDADLGAIRHELERVDVEARLRRALVGERAIGNEIFDALRDGRLAGAGGESPLPIGGATDMLVWSWLGHDRAFYLDTMTRAIAWAGLSWHESAAQVRSFGKDMGGSIAPRFAIASTMLIPSFENSLEWAARMSARVGLARLTLRARSEGAEGARRAASGIPDPFRPGPLQLRSDPDGTLVIWSIGSDFTDDNGEDDSLDEYGRFDARYEPPDIVWRVSPR